MPETELLDLAAEDVDEATWDQLIQGLTGDPDEDEGPDVLTNSASGGCCDGSSDGCGPPRE